MINRSVPFSGIWLPLVTPFRDGALDTESLIRLVEYYRRQPVDGLIVAATTGEGMVLDGPEVLRLVETVAATVAGSLPIVLGISGADTRKVAAAVTQAETWPLDGYLVASPYYTRPGQEGLRLHFEAVAQATDRPVLIYNIPYRTGVNIANDTLLALAEIGNIAGLKDCCADMAQSFDLLSRKGPDFAVLTGEDALFYSALVHGAEGGILASAHIETAAFAVIRDRLLADDQVHALRAWRDLAALPRLLFAEPSPAPIKYWLWRQGLIASPEVRLPITQISPALAVRLDTEMERRGVLAPA